MEKEFVTYEQALALKELGFNESCLAFYVLETNGDYKLYDKCEVKTYFTYISSPLYQQAFRWFREKYGLNSQIAFCEYAIESCNSWKYTFDNPTRQYWNGNFNTYEEAESTCLDKLIEIVKNKLCITLI